MTGRAIIIPFWALVYAELALDGKAEMPFGDRARLLRGPASLHCELAFPLPAVVHHSRPFVRHRVVAVAHLLGVGFMLGSLGFLCFRA